MIGSIISGIGSIAGGLLQNKAAKKNIKLQKEFAQNAIQWKVDDATKAGIHPLYALGANTTSFQPVNVGDYGLGQAGQDFGRAVDAGISNAGKEQVFTRQLAATQLEGLRLDNDIKRARLASTIATVRQAGSPPGVPTAATSWLLDGQGNTPSTDGPEIKLQTRRDVADPNGPFAVYGAGPSVGFHLNPTGGYSPHIPPELAESFEQDKIGQLDWFIRNRVLPYFGFEGGRPPIRLKTGERLYFDRGRHEWVLDSNPRLRFGGR